MKLLPYVIRSGDYLSKLAVRFGFDPEAVWNDEKNQELRALRPNPEILFPGDLIFLPEVDNPPLDVAMGSVKNVEGEIPKVTVRLVLHGDDGKPAAGKAYYLAGATESDGTTDGDGVVELEVPATTRELTLCLEGVDAAYLFRLGHLDPVSTTSGLEQRLVHLGYLPDPHVSSERLARALARFQKDHGVEPTGEADEPTREKLVEAHGA